CSNQRPKSDNDMISPDQHSHRGETPDESESEDSAMAETVESESTTSPTSRHNSDATPVPRRAKRSSSSMQESARPNKPKTSSDKLHPSKKVIRTTQLSRTSVRDSTTNARTLRPFWNASTLEMSRKLLSPTEIGSVGTDLNSSSLSANSMARRSWSTTNQKLRGHNKNSLKISWPSAISSSRETTAGGAGKEGNIKDVRSRKIKLDPTPAWKERLRKWMGTSRWTYNRCLDFLNKKKCKMNKTDFRRNVPKKTSKRNCKTSWVLETPFEIRDSAMVDLYDGIVTNLKKREKNPDHKFSMTFRSRKDVQTIKIPGCCIKDGLMFKRSCGSEKLRGFEDWASYKGEIIIQKDRAGDFYACVTEQSQIVPERVEHPEDLRVVALDPGVRTFNTAVDSKGNVTEFAPGDVGRIYRLCHHMDNLQSKAFDKATPSKRRYNLRKAWHRAIKKVKDLVMDVRNKTVKHLCKNYDVVFLPEFNTKQMVNRAKRRIGKGTARGMMTWSHYSFKELLRTTALREGTKLVIVTEEYTSKTCSCCGTLHHSLGGSKVFKCPSCRTVMDRDENGARNILLK
ncbi:unnamed protein product, partial [Ectocarpus sp. 8 AP-2014]